MLKSNILKAILIMPVLLIKAGISYSQETPSIKNMTGKQSNSVEVIRTDDQDLLKTHAIGIGFGQTFLGGDFEENGEDKITFDLYYTYRASYSFDLLANLHTSEHKFKESRSTLPGLALGIKGKLWSFDSFSPFVLAGFGFYRPKMVREVAVGEFVESEGKYTFGNHVGAGVDLILNRQVAVGAIAHFHNPFDVKQENGPKVEGSYLKLLMTVAYTF